MRPRQKGAVLIVALLLAGIIALSLSSYLKLSIVSLRTANRSFYNYSSIDYAEIGLEQAMTCFYSVSNGVAAATAWNGWNLDTTTKEATRVFPTTGTYAPGPGATAQVRVYVQGYDFTGTPVIVAKATISPPDGAAIEKYVKVTLRARSLFSNGLVARNGIDWNGSPSADAWNSAATSPAQAYALDLRLNKCTVGSISATNGAVDLANGKVYGSVATGGGTVAGSPTVTGGTTYDFSASFPTISAPSPTTTNTVTASIESSVTFPRASDTMNDSDDTYYYTFSSGAGINYTGGGKNVQITADKSVVFIFDQHTGSTAINIGGNAYMNVNAGGALKIYTNGNLTIAGAGFANANAQPSSLQIYGTRTTSGQTLTLNGSGSLRAAVYAPNATVTANGGGTGGIQGSIVANTIDMNGGPDFHYDIALGDLRAGAGVGVTQWKELQSAADRGTYASKFNF